MILLCGGFVDQIYGSCVSSFTDWISVSFGIASILFWMCAQFPQLLTNYKLKRAESLSPIFLGCWLGGDLTNLIGCFLTHQLPTQTYTAVYYISADILLISQAKYYHWYGQKNRSRPINFSDSEEKKPLLSPSNSNKALMIGALLLFPGGLLALSGSSSLLYNNPQTVSDNLNPSINNQHNFLVNYQQSFGTSRVLLEQSLDELLSTPDDSTTGIDITTGTETSSGDVTSTTTTTSSTDTSTTGDDDDDESDEEEYFTFDSWEDYVGYGIGWISAFIYLSSRVPQIYRNFQRKTTEGLSRLMFTFAVLGNVTYAASILVVSVNPWYLLAHMPWILGSAGTLMFDATVFYQTYHYRNGVPVKPPTSESQSINTSIEDDRYTVVDVASVTSSRDYIGLKKSYYYRIGIGMPTPTD